MVSLLDQGRNALRERQPRADVGWDRTADRSPYLFEANQPRVSGGDDPAVEVDDEEGRPLELGGNVAEPRRGQVEGLRLLGEADRLPPFVVRDARPLDEVQRDPLADCGRQIGRVAARPQGRRVLDRVAELGPISTTVQPVWR